MSNPIFSISIIILSLGFSFFYVKPEYDAVQTRKNDIVMLGETLQSAGQISSLIDQTNTTLNSIDPQKLSRFSVFLPETTDPLVLANNIQHMALVHGILLGKIAVEQPDASSQSSTNDGVTITSAPSPAGGVGIVASTAKYVTTKTSFGFTTTNDSFRAFLKDMENSLDIMNITSLTFAPTVSTVSTSKNKGPVAPRYDYSIEIETYSLK